MVEETGRPGFRNGFLAAPDFHRSLCHRFKDTCEIEVDRPIEHDFA